MKRSVKGTIAAALLLSSLSIGSSAMASSHDAVVKEKYPESHVKVNQVKYPDNSAKSFMKLLEPMGSERPIDDVPIKNAKTDSKNFNIPEGYGWVKVWVYNSGTYEIKVSVTDSSGSQKMFFRVPPYGNQKFEISSSPWGTGSHTVSLSSDENMEGKVAVKIAQHQNEL
ncbi:hypothetical protein [Brevibacillus brevis]|uniref:hypothetical protein n=1 Tax=Brevibacillus brevis TaxID=1393 RepID=UPI001C8E65F2|nr:hypothetical protein [Brevibacillus brevis]MBY0084823.1 hypothetical protein [Brevibacillus brevis]UKL00991.1 hypothetical protein FO446_27790 [Brevibacillus brevis]